jgi:uncharacterized protein
MRKSILLSFVVIVALTSACAESQQHAENAGRTVAVSTEGHASAVADQATLHMGFAVFGPDSASVYELGAETSTQIIAALTQAGVPKESIESETQYISQSSQDQLDRFSPAERAAKAYRLQQSWLVKLPPESAGQILDIAVKAGANDSGAIDWSMKDPAALHAKALEDAMTRAKTTAADIARGMGVPLGPLISVANRSLALLPGEIDTAVWGGQGYGYAAGMIGGSGGGGSFRNLLALRPHKIEDTATISAIYSVP